MCVDTNGVVLGLTRVHEEGLRRGFGGFVRGRHRLSFISRPMLGTYAAGRSGLLVPLGCGTCSVIFCLGCGGTGGTGEIDQCCARSRILSTISGPYVIRFAAYFVSKAEP